MRFLPSRNAVVTWMHAHRRILLLKGAVAAILIIAHYFPDSRAGLIANLIWLVVF